MAYFSYSSAASCPQVTCAKGVRSQYRGQRSLASSSLLTFRFSIHTIHSLDFSLEVICLNTITLNWCCSVNCEAELLLHEPFTRGIQNLLPQEPCKGAETDSRAKFGKETVAGAHRSQNGLYVSAQADSGVLRMLRLCSGSAQTLLRFCSGMLTLSSG